MTLKASYTNISKTFSDELIDTLHKFTDSSPLFKSYFEKDIIQVFFEQSGILRIRGTKGKTEVLSTFSGNPKHELVDATSTRLAAEDRPLHQACDRIKGNLNFVLSTYMDPIINGMHTLVNGDDIYATYRLTKTEGSEIKVKKGFEGI